jgi:polysaccharide biosynthesis protein PslH
LTFRPVRPPDRHCLGLHSMRILWLNANLLLPLDKGGKLRTWHLMRHLARRHEITYLSFADPSQRRADYDGMSEVCSRLETVPRTEVGKDGWRFRAGALAHLLDPVPYAVGKYRSREYRRRLQTLLSNERFDLLVCDFLVPVVNLPSRLPCPAVLFTHNVEAEIWRRHREASAGLKRALMGTQYRRMLRFEERALSRFDLVLAVSESDGSTLQRLYGGGNDGKGGRSSGLEAPIYVVPTGVDTYYFSPMPEVPVEPRHLVFTGSMDWLPNEDAIVHFFRQILPRIRKEEPGVTLSIVGRAPTPPVRRLAGTPGVEVTGRVEDVRPHIARAAVYVVPLRIGGGTRLKIFEAMAMGKAVVSTTVGAEGLPVTPGSDIVVADEPASFADAVVSLLRDERRLREIGSAARSLVAEHYDWSAVSSALEDALLRAARIDPPRRRERAAAVWPPDDDNSSERAPEVLHP